MAYQLGERRRLIRAGTAKELADAAAGQWISISRQAIDGRGRFTAAISGGRTPGSFYDTLALFEKPEQWKSTHIFWVDERFVPRGHEDSNYRLAENTLLGHIKIPRSNIHAISTDYPDARAAAEGYERDMRSWFRLREDELPRFDLIVLGIGEDGHTASLFPESLFPVGERRLAIATSSGALPHKRISITLPVINNAAVVMFLLSGKNKAPVLKRIIEEEGDLLPAQRVRPNNGELVFIVDRDAAELLSI